MSTTSGIVRQHTDDWFTFLSQVAFKHIGQISEIYTVQDTSLIENQGMRSLVLAGRGKAHSLEGNLVAAKMLLDEARDQAEEYWDLVDTADPEEILRTVREERDGQLDDLH